MSFTFAIDAFKLVIDAFTLVINAFIWVINASTLVINSFENDRLNKQLITLCYHLFLESIFK